MSSRADRTPARAHRAVGLRLLALTLLACTAVACSATVTDDASPGPSVTGAIGPASTEADLGAIGLSDELVDALDRVELTNVTVDDAVGLRMWLQTELDEVPVPLFADSERVYFVAPFASQDPLAGGVLDLRLDRDGVATKDLRLGVEPLPEAPGAWQAFLDRFTDAIDEAAAVRQSSFDELRETGFDDVDPALVGLKLAQSYADDGSGSDLASIWDAAPDDDDRVMLDALVGAMDLESLFEAAEPQGLRRSTAPTGMVAGERAVTGPHIAPQAMPRIAPRSVPAGGECIDPGVEVLDAADLSSLYEVAVSNALVPGGPRQDVLQKMGTVTTAGGFIPVVGWASAATGAALIAYETYLNGTAGLYPSALADLRAEISPQVFPEDFTVDGSWTTVTVTATSTGWSADADVARGLLAALSATTSGLSGLDPADGLVLDVGLFVRDNTANAYVEHRATSGGLLTFCPQRWDVDVSGEPWTQGEAVLDRFEVDSTGRYYRPTETGLNLPVDDTLRIALDPTRFARTRLWQDHPISVLPIVLSGESVVEVTRPGEEFDLSVAVTNATNPELAWNTDQGGWRGDARLVEAGEIIGAPAVWERTHVTPSAAGDFPYLIMVEPVSSTGLRADGDPPRRHIVEVRLKELVIEPDPGTVVVNGSLQFVARGADGDIAEVTWTSTGGTIDADGVFTAGTRPGTYTVNAVSVDDPAITANATVVVVEADCIVGTWRLRSQEFLDQIVQAYGEGSRIQHRSGEYVTTFGDAGEFRGERRAWQFGIETEGQLFGVTIDSVETGTWSLDPTGTLLLIDETSSDATVSMTLNGDPMPIGPQSISSPSLGGSATFECAGDVLTMTITDSGGDVAATLDRGA